MKIYYQTGWQTAAVHFCPHGDSGIWSTESCGDVPGAMGWKVVDLPKATTGAEFVVCNGEGTQWDNPPAEVGGQNYKTPVGPASGYTLRWGKLMRISDREPVMIVSDLDHTMVGHEHDGDNGRLRDFQANWLGRFRFTGSRLVYSTGRNKNDALAVARERDLLRPDLLICGVGTEVYEVPEDLPMDGSWSEFPDRITLNEEWTTKMEGTFDRGAVEALLIDKFPKFEPRGSFASDPYRIPSAYEVDENMEENLRLVREALGPDVQVITSGGAEWKLVDFCSAQAGKMKACEFAIQRFGIPAERTLVCGDSGNDESMYRCPGVRGVAVGNSLPELVAALRGMAESGPEAVSQGAVFSTKMKSEVLYATQPVASAIVEALDRFFG